MNPIGLHHELVLTRVLRAPRSLVWKVWTDPQHLAQWWGPKDFTNPVCKVDLRVGGELLIHMQGPDGMVYPTIGQFNEIVEPERLVFTGSVPNAAGEPIFQIRNTVTLSEHAGETTLTLHARVLSLSDAAAPYLSGLETGWTQSLIRLQDTVARVLALESSRNSRIRN